MKVIGPLMTEHRVIERMIAAMALQAKQMESRGQADTDLLAVGIDFLRSYADRTHHGKEEDILFRDLAKKKMSPEHARIVAELVEEHKFARSTVRRLVEAKNRYLQGEATLPEIVECLTELVSFYPRHIEKEDKHFFFPILDYFSAGEQERMLKEFREFDREMIHEKYRKVVEAAGGGTIIGP